MGHGYVASGVARHIHRLLHKFQDIRDTAGLLASLNDEFTLNAEDADGPLRMTTVVTGTFDGSPASSISLTPRIRACFSGAPARRSFTRSAMAWKIFRLATSRVSNTTSRASG